MQNRNIIIVFIVAVAAIAWFRFADAPSPDLLATWMAGKYYGEGIFDQIYPKDTDVFEMLPPSDWLPYLRSTGYEDSIFPFIYPPIWAYFASILGKVTSFDTFSSIASFINPLLLATTIWLAIKMVAEKSLVLPIMALTVLIFMFSIPALVAIEQNQPQILVSFLLVFAVERTRNNSPVLGGALMAVAAAIKLYPAIFALLWLAQGEKRAAAAFTIFGAAIGLSSIAIAGWPLHAEFLSEMRVISSSVVVTYLNYSIDPTIAGFFFADQFRYVDDLRVVGADEIASGWNVLAKPTLWRVADLILMIATIATLFLIARSRVGQDVLFWPLAFTLIALVSPLTWGYHYLPALAFAGAFLFRFSSRTATLMLAAVFLPTSVIILMIQLPFVSWSDFIQPTATFAMALYAVFLWIAMRKHS